MGYKGKILLVEDEAIFAIYIETYFSDLGFKVLGPIVTGESAIEVNKEEKPDIIIIDVNLAGKMDGIEAAQIINESYSIPIIFMTGYDDKKFYERAQKLNPVAYLNKPLNMSELESIIVKAIKDQK